MLRSALLLGAGIAAALVFACVPPPAAAPPPPPVAPASMAAAGLPAAPLLTCDATTFTNKVAYYNDPMFHPMKNGPLPTTIGFPAGPNYLAGLRDAFNAAPPGFQQALCNLNGVYVNGTNCAGGAGCFSSSWGWSRKSGPNRQTLVGLSTALWGYNYEGYENALTDSILPQSGVTYSNTQSCTAAGVCFAVNNPATALLAALAHEVGHLRWFDTVNPANYCTPNFFAYGWNKPYHQAPGSTANGYWRDLLTPNNRGYLRSHGNFLDRHKNPPQIDDIDNQAPGSVAQNQLIYQLLVSLPSVPPAPIPPWASLFAAMTPDEDFVETYKFKVLTDQTPNATGSNHPLTSVWITVPNGQGAGANGTANIVADYRNSARGALAAKVGCITSY